MYPCIIFPAVLHALRRSVRSGHRSRLQSGLHGVRRMRRGGRRIAARPVPRRTLDHPHRHDHLPPRCQHPSTQSLGKAETGVGRCPKQILE